MKSLFFKLAARLAVFPLALLLGQAVARAETAVLTVTPNSVSNTYVGFVTLQITGLTNGETVIVQKYLDLNGNGIVDSNEGFGQQFTLTDGAASVFHDGATPITNINVPGDTDNVSGQITAQLLFPNGDFTQNAIAKFLFVVSSPTTNFPAVTKPFTVTNFPFSQTLHGSVVNNGTNVPYAGIDVFPPPRPGHGPGNPVALALADASGNYSVNLPVGSYVPVPFKTNLIANFFAAPLIALASNATVSTNLFLTTSSETISGRYVDAATNSTRLPGLLIPANTQADLIGAGFSDAGGNFSIAVTPGVWQVGSDTHALAVHGYPGLQQGTNVDASAGSVSNVIIALPYGTALFYGSVKDTNGNPMPGIAVASQDENGQYEADVLTDVNGQYAAVAVANQPGDLWQVQVSNGSDSGNPTNLIYSDSAYSQGTNLSVGQAVKQSFAAALATNVITGHVKDNHNNPISGVGLSASATINGKNFSNGNGDATTDTNGSYSLTVAQGNWNVSVNCNGNNNSLSSLGYSDCPGSQMVNISTSNGVADFTVQTTTTTLSGRVVQANGQPVTFMNVFASPNGGGTTYGATTDGGGNFSMGIDGGSYMVAMNTDPVTGAASLGLVSPFLPVTITDGANVSNVVLIAQHVTGTIIVSVKNGANNASIEGIYATANLTLNGTNYGSGTQTTDSAGHATLEVFNGNWSVGLPNTSAGNQNISINNNTNTASFGIAFSGASPPALSSPVRLSPTQVQFTLTGVQGKTYTVQASAALPNWTTILQTNAPASVFTITDTNASAATRFYRVLTPP